MIGPFCAKYKTFDLKKYREVTFYDTEESTDLWFGQWHEEFGKFSSEHLKVSKLVFSWDLFVQSRKLMSYELTENSEEGLTCSFKIDIKNLTNFDLRTQKPQKCTL